MVVLIMHGRRRRIMICLCAIIDKIRHEQLDMVYFQLGARRNGVG
jgi:hypothetical protein